MPFPGAPPTFGEFSTHDHTTTASAPGGLREVWADVKTPGDGRTYSVGTIEVTSADIANPPMFSNRFVTLPLSPAQPFAIAGATTKQIVILQCSGRSPTSSGPNADQDILWQTYWYGDSTFDLNVLGRAEAKATNARAISVWPVADPNGALNRRETRVAICGETYDSVLPNNQFDGASGWSKIDDDAPAGTIPASGVNTYPRGLPNGYIAVFDGEGQFLWSHQFFFQDPETGGAPEGPEGLCAITDVSIRVEDTPTGRRDVVTYCGISSFGNRNEPGASLTPLLAFPAPLTGSTGYVPAGGASDNGQGQWDGIVGRVSNEHLPHPQVPLGSAASRDFHAIAGGQEQDGLFGIAEMPGDRFVVVGSTATNPVGVSGSGGATFPFTVPNYSWNTLPSYCVGVVMVFDAAPTKSGQALVLESSLQIGTPAPEFHSHAADVIAQLDTTQVVSNPRVHRIVIAGTTDDPGLFASLAIPGSSFTPFGIVPGPQGFVLPALDHPANGTPGLGLSVFKDGTFQGFPAVPGGFCGIAAWNEHLDHVALVGRIPANSQDLEVSSFFVDTSVPSGTANYQFQPVRRGIVSAATAQEPAAMGAIHALVVPPGASTDAGLAYVIPGLGSPAGGGVAVDERGRVNIVGSTTGSGYPTNGGAFARFYRNGVDAVRTVVSLLPNRVGRTDGTGAQVHHGAAIPLPAPPATGGTSPACALQPLGTQVGVGVPSGVVPLRRMHIDWQGPDPGPTPGGSPAIHAVLIDRPPPDTQIVGTMVMFGVPVAPTGVSGPNPLGPGGVENWVPGGVTHSLQLFPSTGPESVRIPFVLPPGTGATFSVQAVMLLAAPLAPANPTNCVVPASTFAATPAIVFSY